MRIREKCIRRKIYFKNLKKVKRRKNTRSIIFGITVKNALDEKTPNIAPLFNKLNKNRKKVTAIIKNDQILEPFLTNNNDIVDYKMI